MKSLLSPVLVILVVIIGYFYMKPMYEHIGKLAEKRDESKNLLESIQNMGMRLGELETEYNSFSDYERGVLSRLIPRRVTESDLAHDITAMALTHNLSVKGVTFAGEIEEQRPVTLGGEEMGGEIGAAPQAPFKEWNTTIEVTGDYENFKSFIADIGRNMRISDVAGIEIGSEQGQESGGNSYTISALVYSIE